MYFCKVCRYGFNNLNPDAGYSNILCSRQCKAAQARIAALEDVVRELLCRGESLSFYYASSHGNGCGCVPCGRLSNWEESAIKALELVNQNGGK